MRPMKPMPTMPMRIMVGIQVGEPVSLVMIFDSEVHAVEERILRSVDAAGAAGAEVAGGGLCGGQCQARDEHHAVPGPEVDPRSEFVDQVQVRLADERRLALAAFA